jgi:excisionase family DNA binding protein
MLAPAPAQPRSVERKPNGKMMSSQSTVGTPTPLFEPLLDSREAAALLHMHHKTLERKARESEIPGYQIAGRWYFRATELDAWLRTQLKSASANLVRVN